MGYITLIIFGLIYAVAMGRFASFLVDCWIKEAEAKYRVDRRVLDIQLGR